MPVADRHRSERRVRADLSRSARRLLGVLCLTFAFAMAAATSAGAQEPSTTVATSIPESGGMLPRPNTGVPPEDPGDRGGILQATIFFVIVAGVGVIGILVVRESRAKRAERGF